MEIIKQFKLKLFLAYPVFNTLDKRFCKIRQVNHSFVAYSRVWLQKYSDKKTNFLAELLFFSLNSLNSIFEAINKYVSRSLEVVLLPTTGAALPVADKLPIQKFH